MITVEGCDNTGKTTLVKRLCSDFPQLKYHPSIGNKHDIEQIIEQAYYLAEEADVEEIWDRSRLISEYIYATALKRRLAFSYRTFLRLLAEWLHGPQMLIYCKRPIVDILAGFDEREQLGGVKENLVDIYFAYENTMGFLQPLFQDADPPKFLIEYNWEEDHYDDLRDLVARYLVEAKELVG